MSMEGGLSDSVRDFRLKVNFIDRREVVHSYDDPDAPPLSPPRLEHWKSEKQPIGGGGQGQVYLQKCIRGSRLYARRAVKTIPIQGGSAERRYIRELETTTKFSHEQYSRYFVKLLGWYESDDSLCIAMEYFPDGDLQAYLRSKNRLPEDDTRHIVNQVLKGLEIMHREGFTHGDVKPKNVLIKRFPTDEGPHTWWIKLADFGISKRMREASGATTVVGTGEYMAPELLLHGNPPGTNYLATDMWALGAMAFRMLTQTPVFLGPFEAARYLYSQENFLPAGRLNDHHVSPDGRDFTCALLQLEPDQRLDSEAALLHSWIRPCMPNAPVTIPSSGSRSSHPPSTASSSSSSRRSSFDKERGMTTQLSSIPNLPNAEQMGNMQPASILASGESSSEELGKRANSDVPVALTVPPNDKTDPISPADEQYFSSHFGGTEDTPLLDGVGEENADLPNRSSAPSRSDEKASPALKTSKASGARVSNVHVRDSNRLSSESEQDRTQLLNAVQNGLEAEAALLLKKGADTEMRDSVLRRTPLSWAAEQGHETMAKLLLENGAELESADRSDRTPLSWAARTGNDTMVKLLLEKGAKLESKDNSHRTPLSCAAKEGHKTVAKLLLDNGAELDPEDICRQTPLSLATEYDHEAIVSMLVERGAKLDSKDKFGQTPLSWAAREGHETVVKLLLEKDPDLNAKDKYGKTPLSWALMNKDEKVSKLLLEKGAKADDWKSNDY